MKKHLLLLSLAYTAITAYGQTSIPNGNFETWNTVSYDYPQNYPYTSNTEVLSRYQSVLPFNVVKSTSAHSGSYAVQVSTLASGADTAMGYFINTNPNSGDPSTWTGGMPYTEKPTGITGYYKYNKATGDSATIIVVFNKGGINIGTYMFNFGGYHTDYFQFNFTLSPALTQTPDAVIFAASSSNIMVKENGVAGSVLVLDDVSFTGVTSQPALMNGNFEAWDSQTINNPADWYIEGESGSAIRTTDAHKGNYAIELKTFPGTDQNNNPIARAGQIATGYYPRNCNSNCNQLGGFPYSAQNDVLTFWYKYLPMGKDTAQLFLNFKKNGSSFWADGVGTNLFPSANYQYVEMPFNLWQAPDTVIVNIQSSVWNHTLVSYVGSTLIIDEIQFKSQPILYAGLPAFTAKEQLSVFPNPSDGKFSISNEAGISQIIVYNMLGKQVYSKITPNLERISDLDLSNLNKGIYFLEINSGAKLHTQKIVIR